MSPVGKSVEYTTSFASTLSRWRLTAMPAAVLPEVLAVISSTSSTRGQPGSNAGSLTSQPPLNTAGVPILMLKFDAIADPAVILPMLIGELRIDM